VSSARKLSHPRAGRLQGRDALGRAGYEHRRNIRRFRPIHSEPLCPQAVGSHRQDYQAPNQRYPERVTPHKLAKPIPLPMGTSG
jgi:hypothetical protein